MSTQAKNILSCRFLTLPAEIRTRIYEFILELKRVKISHQKEDLRRVSAFLLLLHNFEDGITSSAALLHESSSPAGLE
jgi:hypothetical protein